VTLALEFGLLIVGAYLVGSIPMAYLVAKWYRGEDIRKYGSGQVGASNLFRSFSKPLGITVGLYDLGKGILMVWIAQLLGMTLIMQLAIGSAVIIGHNWPVFLRFNAGRGLATTVGICLFLLPWGLIPFIAIALFTLVIGSSPLPMLLAMMSLPVTSWVLQYLGRPQPLTLTLGLTFLLLLMVIRRLSAPRTLAATPVSTREFLLTRLLFDRDIKDGKTWIHRKPSGSPKPKEKKDLEK
jgi:glycerol-3-phosphate acyltransferase PlsY